MFRAGLHTHFKGICLCMGFDPAAPTWGPVVEVAYEKHH